MRRRVDQRCACCGTPMPVATVARLTVRSVDGVAVEVDPVCHGQIRLAHPSGHVGETGVRLFLRSHRSSL